jgi:hypothetical protein
MIHNLGYYGGDNMELYAIVTVLSEGEKVGNLTFTAKELYQSRL